MRNGARVYAKPRVADLLPIEGRGITNEHSSFVLERFDVPLATLGSRHLSLSTGSLDCVAWLVELFFMSRAIDDAEAKALRLKDGRFLSRRSRSLCACSALGQRRYPWS